MPTRSFLRHLVPHLAAIIVIALCVKLALWQAGQAESKEALLAAWSDAPPVDLHRTTDRSHDQYQRVSAQGRFDPRRHVLLDNQLRHGRGGVHVFTPFSPANSDRIWLVNRGWQPLEHRDGDLPAVETPAGSLNIRGRLSEPPRVGLQIGHAETLDPEHWPNLMTYFDLDRIREALGDGVEDRVILLDPDHPAHLTKDGWQPVVFGPDRHRAYVFQWLSIALTVFIIWLVLSIRSYRQP